MKHKTNRLWALAGVAVICGACLEAAAKTAITIVEDEDIPDVVEGVPEDVAESFVNFLPAGFILVAGAPDYSSVSLSLLDRFGDLAREDFLNSGSTAPGLSTTLGSDVVVARTPSPNRDIVVIDRGNSVLTWIAARTAEIDDVQLRGQMVVGEAFYGHNPQDYLAISPFKAYVSRAGVVYDGDDYSGDDLLVVDPSKRTELGTIALSAFARQSPESEAPNFAAPFRLMAVEDLVYVVLQNLTNDGSWLAATASVLAIDPDSDTVVADLAIAGLENCSAAAYSKPDQKVFLACGGNFAKGPALQLARSGLAVIDVADPRNPILTKTIPADDFADTPLGIELGLVGPAKVAVIASGEMNWDTFEVIHDEVVFVVDTTASTNIATDIHRVEGAFQLSVYADPVQERLYVGDAYWAGPFFAVYDTDRLTGQVEHLRDLSFANGFAVRTIAIY